MATYSVTVIEMRKIKKIIKVDMDVAASDV